MGKRSGFTPLYPTKGNYPANRGSPLCDGLSTHVRAQDMTMADHVSNGQQMEAARSSFEQPKVEKQWFSAGSAFTKGASNND